MPSYVLNNPYMISYFKKVRNIKPLPTLEIIDREIGERTSVNVNPLRELEDPRLFNKLD